MGRSVLFSKALLEAGALFVGLASISATAGYLVGRTENSSVIAAAVVTALLGAMLTWCAWAAKDKNIRYSILAGFGTAFFCLIFILVMNLTINSVASEDRIAWEQELLLTEKLLERHLEQCSELEFRINKAREKVGLPQLSSEIVCGRP